jgi:N-acetylglucosaminyl-diphospho-decaprenol L-rhamnosyltransferase
VSAGTATWAAVVVNHEAGALLARCVDSLLADGSAGAPEVVVVDNASGDGSAETLRATHPGVTVISAPGNVGYARAANLGIAATRAPVVAVLNPDTETGAGTASAVLGRFEGDDRVAAVGPRVRNPDGSDYPSARSVPSTLDAIGHGIVGLLWRRNPFTRRYRQLDADPAVPRAVDWVSGCAVWLRRDALDAVGGWDERYFLYVEDVDLCWRLRRAGWSIVYEPGGQVTHVQGASTARRPYRMILEHHRSLWLFARTRYRGARALALPLVAAYLAARTVMAWAEHAVRARRPATPVRVDP